ncbi:MAG: pilus assembly protein TadG-related protein [Acidobacteriaceae bacterium]
MKLHRNESGQMLIMMAIELTLLLGFLALAADVGVLFHTKRQLQIVTDAAATAGAMNQMNTPVTYTNGVANPSDTVYAACIAVADNGYGSSSDCSKGMTSPFTTSDNTTVTINTPPSSGYHKSTGYVEAILSKPDPLYFFKFFTGDRTATVAARAVAGSPGPSTTCAFLMDQTGVDLQMQGNSTINSPNCSWYVNSDGSAAGETTSQTGGAATLNAPYVTSVGPAGSTILGGAPVYSNSKPSSAPPVQSVGAVPPGDCSVTYSTFPNPGTPLDGGNGVVCFTGTNVDISGQTLNNGVFVFKNGVVVGNPNGNTNMTNATLEVYGGAFTQNSNSLFNISAPCANLNSYSACQADTFGSNASNQLSYDGVALLVPAANTYYNTTVCDSVVHGTLKNKGGLTVQIGSSGQNFDGYIVAPNADVFLNDNGGSVAITGLVAGCLFNKSSTLSLTNYNIAHSSTSPLRYIALVE